MANRTVHVAILPALLRRDGLDTGVVCVVDLLRASTTMVRAIDSGASAIRIVAEPADAIKERDALGAGKAVAAGERDAVAPPGFDLGNSPGDFTRERVHGKMIAFTTTNGTKMVMGVKQANAMIIGCLQNRRAAAAKLAAHTGAVTVVCSGTDGRISLEDCIAAGGILDALLETAKNLELNDPAWMCVCAWRGASTDSASLARVIGDSAGAKNLAKVHLSADVAECLRVDVTTAVPRWNGEALVAS